jgi:hypothetical protein
MTRIRTLFTALIRLSAGAILALVALEAILQVNTHFLPRGVPAPAPIDAPLSETRYTVSYSDADVFLWRPDLVAQISPDEDKLEAQVVFQTDLFGFRNPPTPPEDVDIVVLGRSTSLGAPSARPWPQVLQTQSGLQVLNLAQSGATLEARFQYLCRYGLPRNPKWVIVEVNPPLDILGYRPSTNSIAPHLAVPILQYFLQPFAPAPPYAPIYPIPASINGHNFDLVCCIHYTDFYSLDIGTLAASGDWALFRQLLTTYINDLRQQGIKVAILYLPQKGSLYFPLVDDPQMLAPIAASWRPLKLDEDDRLVTDPQGEISPAMLQANAYAARDLLAGYAGDDHLLFIDPSAMLSQAASEGQLPYMVYDSHWNQKGHDLVAVSVLQAITKGEGN